MPNAIERTAMVVNRGTRRSERTAYRRSAITWVMNASTATRVPDRRASSRGFCDLVGCGCPHVGRRCAIPESEANALLVAKRGIELHEPSGCDCNENEIGRCF